tara:strand:+ start:279 stop:500 length:222 start_codon:yes stop_codon:yes gene_type:complete
MSRYRYTYTFINNGIEQVISACNLVSAMEKLGIEFTRMDRHSNWYLASTPFNERERYVWVGTNAYKVKQFMNY